MPELFILLRMQWYVRTKFRKVMPPCPDFSQCFHHGHLRATLNSQLQIELLEFSVLEHQEFVSISSLRPLPNPSDASDAKSSPRSKQLGKRAVPQAQQPQGVAMPESNVKAFGLSPIVLRFLEVCIYNCHQ